MILASRDTGVHEIKFERNTVTGKWRCFCSCGWGSFGDEDEIKKAAAVHDRWEPAE